MWYRLNHSRHLYSPLVYSQRSALGIEDATSSLTGTATGDIFSPPPWTWSAGAFGEGGRAPAEVEDAHPIFRLFFACLSQLNRDSALFLGVSAVLQLRGRGNASQTAAQQPPPRARPHRKALQYF